MTILEALKIVLSQHPDGLTNKEAYEEIIKQNLYEFSAKKPDHIVNGLIRRHCYGLDFPTANPIKYFKITGYRGKKPLYSLIDTKETVLKTLNKKLADEETLPEEKIQKFYEEHLENIYSQLIDNIMTNSPAFLNVLL